MDKVLGLFLLLIFMLSSCKNEPKKSSAVEIKTSVCAAMPKFNRDSALSYVQRQVDFGPRIPGSESHTECLNWFFLKFESFGLNPEVQEFNAKLFTGDKFIGKNVVVQINPKIKNRVLLCAHWDSRPWADNEEDNSLHKEAVPGANDGASGAGVLIEIARIFSQFDINLGVDIVFFDLEDAGQNNANDMFSWGLGSQYWSKNLYPLGYRAKFGILLDMVGSKNAIFPKERSSLNEAEEFVHKTWRIAKILGHNNIFVDQVGRPVTDDHTFINMYTDIPTLDIIHTENNQESSFFEHWHTTEDDMKDISKRTLGAVGEVVMNVLCREADGTF